MYLIIDRWDVIFLMRKQIWWDWPVDSILNTVFSHSVVLNSAMPWTVALGAPLSMEILQARKLERVAMSFSRGSSQPRDWTQVSSIAGRFFTIWGTREAHTEHWINVNMWTHGVQEIVSGWNLRLQITDIHSHLAFFYPLWTWSQTCKLCSGTTCNSEKWRNPTQLFRWTLNWQGVSISIIVY